MPYSWTEDISPGASIDAADINEMKQALDDIYSDHSLTYPGCASGAGWVALPVNPGDPISSTQFYELRDRTDYAWEEVCCTGHCEVAFSPEDTAEYTMDDPGFYVTVNDSQNALEDSAARSAEDYGERVSEDVGYDVSVDSGDDNGAYSGHRYSQNIGADSGVDNNDHGTYDSNEHTTFRSTYHADYDVGENTGYRSTDHDSVNSPHNSSVCSSYKAYHDVPLGV